MRQRFIHDIANSDVIDPKRRFDYRLPSFYLGRCATQQSITADALRTVPRPRSVDMRTETFPLNDPAGLGIFLVMARALAPGPFQPDADARWRKAESRSRAEESPRVTANVANAPAAAMRSRKLRWLERLDRWFWAQQQRDIETYLARSKDIHDLEQRMRNLERGHWQRYY
jgi:hypothetical protein